MNRDLLVRASDLYELSECPHRITLDRRWPRSARSAPDAATATLLARGLAHEAAIEASLGYPRPEYTPGDLDAGAAATEAMMAAGADGIFQAVLRRGHGLAIPDFIERAPGRSRWGEHHYIPGDVKSGLTPRADQALQVAFAGRLLHEIQDRQPEVGVLILGDGRREQVPLDRLTQVTQAAIERVASIAAGQLETEPFYDHRCSRCRWREACARPLCSAGDVSLVDGITPTRASLLRRCGIDTVERLAATTPDDASGVSFDLERLVLQARALAGGVIAPGRAPRLPRGFESALIVHVETNPLDQERILALAWCRCGGGGAAEVLVTPDHDARTAALPRLRAALRHDGASWLHFGSGGARALQQLAEQCGLPPSDVQSLFTRRHELLAILRSGALWLPVHRYELAEVAAVLAGEPLPDPLTPETPAYVFAAADSCETGPIAECTLRALQRTQRIADWLLAQRGAVP